MKKIILLCLVFLYASNSFAADCATREYIMTNWTGECVNGKAQGYGSGRANYTAENYSINIVGKFQALKNGAYKTGFYFEDWGSGESKKIKVYKIDESASTPSDINKEILSCICVEECKPHITKNSIWASNGNRNEVLDKSESKFTTEQLISLVYANLQSKGIDSMDPVTFKSFLFAEQAKAVVAEKQKLHEMADDPPVAGIKLSLGGDSKSTKKSKKKN